MLQSRIFFLLLLTGMLSACRYTAVDYQQQYAVPNGGWKYDFTPHFSFQVDDTLADYQLFFLLRHTNAYPYSNLWIRIKSKNPGDTQFADRRIEVTLTEPFGVNSDGSKSGRWLGRGMGEIFEQVRPLYTLQKPLRFYRSGTYELVLSQDMRISPLPEILQVGLRLQKLGVPKTAAGSPPPDTNVVH